MALTATTVFEVENGGSDTANGGCFDPGNSSMATDLAASSGNTSSPVVTSASYNFQSSDVGACLFIKTGTNWIAGWYKIASVASNAATLSATIGSAVLTSYLTNSAAGCAATASPTGGTWAIDYSQQGTVAFSLTGLTTSAANAIILTSSATVAMVGNGIQITGGTNFTNGIYLISSASAGTSLTVDRTCTTAAGSAGSAGIGGAFASPGMAGSALIGSNMCWVKYSATVYAIESASKNIAGGAISVPSGTTTAFTAYLGYNALRGDIQDTNQLLASPLYPPTLQVGSGVTSCTIFTNTSTNNTIIKHFILDGNSVTGSNAYYLSGSNANICDLIGKNCKGTNGTFQLGTGSGMWSFILAQNGASWGFYGGTNIVLYCCGALGCAQGGFITGHFHFCIAAANTSNGGYWNVVDANNCVAYDNTGYGLYFINSDVPFVANCITTQNSNFGYYFSTSSTGQFPFIQNVVYDNNGGTGNAQTSLNAPQQAITLTGNPFVNPTGSVTWLGDLFRNFQLNNTVVRA